MPESPCHKVQLKLFPEIAMVLVEVTRNKSLSAFPLKLN